MPSYKVVIANGSQEGHSLSISADDVNLDSCVSEDGDCHCQCHFFNFLKGDVTVAAIPFSAVLSITS